MTLTDWMVADWIRKGYAHEIDPGKVTNKANILHALTDAEFDPGRTHSLTWQSGFAGLVWRKDKVPHGLRSVSDLWDPVLHIRVVVPS